MFMHGCAHDTMEDEIQLAAQGKGPLLQRDYWGVIRECRIGPAEIIDLLREQFQHFSPKDLVRFGHNTDEERPLREGDVLDVSIRMAPKTKVRVVKVDAGSLTIATLKGHPEAGKITFGAYRNERDDVIFHIRSRARSKSSMHFAGFLTAGDPMQTNTWAGFIDRLAHSVGEGVVGAINAEKQEVEDDRGDEDASAPTFVAKVDRARQDLSEQP